MILDGLIELNVLTRVCVVNLTKNYTNNFILTNLNCGISVQLNIFSWFVKKI